VNLSRNRSIAIVLVLVGLVLIILGYWLFGLISIGVAVALVIIG